MKPEKEVFWLVNILKSNFKRKTFGKSIGGHKSEFEQVANSSLNSKEFRTFLQELIDSGCLEFLEKKYGRGGWLNTYVINEKKIMKKIKSTEFGGKFYKACFDHYTSLRFG